MISTGDALSDFEKDDSDKYEKERRQPHCCSCGSAIWDEYLWDFMDALYCEDCMNDKYRKSTENYARD